MHAVSLQLFLRMPFHCSLWLDAEDGWTGVCERMSVTVRGGSFEDAKRNLEESLQERVERILREHIGNIGLSA